MFTGDTFGLSYREFDRDGRAFVVPTSSPVHFDPAAAHRSVDLIAGLAPDAVYVTHYGEIREIPRLAADLHRLLDAYVAMARAVPGTGASRHRALHAGMTRIVLDEAARQAWPLPDTGVLEVLGGDIELNAQGLGVWLDSGGGRR